jgi:transcriptional regulator with XRE-family HTH domain
MTIEKLVKLLDGLNYSEVARRAKVTRAYISVIARGLPVNPTVNMAERIAKAAKAVRADMNKNAK